MSDIEQKPVKIPVQEHVLFGNKFKLIMTGCLTALSTFLAVQSGNVLHLVFTDAFMLALAILVFFLDIGFHRTRMIPMMLRIHYSETSMDFALFSKRFPELNESGHISEDDITEVQLIDNGRMIITVKIFGQGEEQQRNFIINVESKFGQTLMRKFLSG